jgi:Protein of unknown function (DUF4236)
MSFRFRRSIKILPGIRLNFGKRGISTSIGVRGAHITLGRAGTGTTVGIPGTGTFCTLVLISRTMRLRLRRLDRILRRVRCGAGGSGLRRCWLSSAQ